MPIRLVLADDHPIVLQGLQRLFETQPDFDRPRVTRLVVLDSTISGNTAQDGWGGGLYENGSDSPVMVQNSTISAEVFFDLSLFQKV